LPAATASDGLFLADDPLVDFLFQRQKPAFLLPVRLGHLDTRRLGDIQRHVIRRHHLRGGDIDVFPPLLELSLALV
jgi:hypothetical protein